MQTPPQFSAIKVSGERAYDLARDGETVELAARQILIKRLEIDGEPGADSCSFSADCGKGAYVRALARDIGRVLGCLGHVVALRRTRVGPFNVDDCATMEKLQGLAAALSPEEAPGEARARLLTVLKPVETALGAIPALVITSSDAGRLRRGQGVIIRGRDAPVVSGPVYVTLRERSSRWARSARENSSRAGCLRFERMGNGEFPE